MKKYFNCKKINKIYVVNMYKCNLIQILKISFSVSKLKVYFVYETENHFFRLVLIIYIMLTR